MAAAVSAFLATLAGKSPKTQRTYATGLNRLHEFLEEEGLPPAAVPTETWKDVLTPHRTATRALFDDAFIAHWKAEPWAPCEEDRKAAAKLHMEINSRIASQRLGYLDGVEQRALDSVYALFQRTRDICSEHPLARHFDALVWPVLNTHVRPFTASRTM